ncbi:MAG: DUF2244 domain-containing protein [Hyphomicrobiaceae bacterium]|nr:DUF2244 domain-containing protein [Hyphomicrobiaceae bacterium]
MQDIPAPETGTPAFRAVLVPHRSLPPKGFLILMAAVSGVSFVAGMVFYALGAWPVMGFFGLDVAIIYLAFHLNYRAGRAHEVVEVTHETLTITHTKPSGRSSAFTCNPYWARVALRTWPDGRTDLRIVSHGRAFTFGQFLNDEEKRDFAHALQDALAANRTRDFAL